MLWTSIWEFLDCKEIHPVHPKGDQSWVFIGRTDVEAETPIFGHLMRRVDSLENTLMLGGVGGRRRRGQQRMRWLASLTQWTWVWASSRNWWWTGKPGVVQSMGSQRVGHYWATELNWTCIPGIKPTWSWYMIFVICWWILFDKFLLRIFASMFISDIDL